MAVTKLSNSGIKTGVLKYDSMLAGNPAFSPNSFESIATVTVGGGGASTVNFNSIPNTYAHLEIRGVARTESASNSTDNVGIRFNGDTGTNYTWHWVYTTGAAAPVIAGSAGDNTSYVPRITRDGTQTGTYALVKLSILDYANTNKNKVMRCISGAALAGSQDVIWYSSGAWLSTNAITSITLTPQSGNFKQHTTFALYGIKVI
jgi:hypothetical protein